MSLDDLIFGEDDDAAMRQGTSTGDSAGGCALLFITLLFGVAAIHSAFSPWRRWRGRCPCGLRRRTTISTSNGRTQCCVITGNCVLSAPRRGLTEVCRKSSDGVE